MEVETSNKRYKMGRYHTRKTQRRVSRYTTKSKLTKNLSMYPFVRTFAYPFTILDTAAGYHKADVIKLNQCPNYAEFTSLFDQYRITRVDIKFLFDKNSATFTGASAQFIPNIYTVFDPDDGTPLSTENDYLQYQSLRVNRMDTPVYRTIYPCTATPAYSGGAFSGYTEVKNAWIDCGNPATEYYGLKYWIDTGMAGGAGGNTLGQLKVFYTVHIQFKTVR